MDEVILRSLQGRTRPDEEAALARWRALDPANEARWRKLAGVWALAGEAAPPPPDVPRPPFEAVLERARRDAAKPAPSRRFGRAVAVGLLAASLAGLGLVLRDPGAAAPPPPVRAALQAQEIVTGAGELTTVTLADGTSIRLGPASRLRLLGEGPDEVVELEGRAFFGVRSDSTRRFIVRTPSGEALVRGTRFEVRAEGDAFRVLVVDGRVRVAAAGASVELGESSMGRVDPGGGLATSEVADVYGHLGWMGNSLVFQNTPLPRAIEEIERRLGLDVVLRDRELDGVTVTATFTDQTVDEMVLVLCGMLGARCFTDAQGRAVIAAPSPARTEPVP